MHSRCLWLQSGTTCNISQSCECTYCTQTPVYLLKKKKLFTMIRAGKLILICLACIIVATSSTISRKNVEELHEDNWERMLTGEWMVEFYAPWCPACKDLEPIWSHLGDRKKELGINVGRIDVTDSPGLSGRFMVTALPTIYHVKDKLFRQYKSPRDSDSLVNFVRSKTWMKVEPISSWKSPTSIQMSIISQFFKMSQVLRGIHTKLMEDFGLPTWGSYLIFAIATILIGAILGLIIVCIIDFIYPPRPSRYQNLTKKRKDSVDRKDKHSDDEDFIENVKDDLVDEEGSESDKEAEKSEKVGKATEGSASSPNARKRKPRKAD